MKTKSGTEGSGILIVLRPAHLLSLQSKYLTLHVDPIFSNKTHASLAASDAASAATLSWLRMRICQVLRAHVIFLQNFDEETKRSGSAR